MKISSPLNLIFLILCFAGYRFGEGSQGPFIESGKTMKQTNRLKAYTTVSTQLASLSDQALLDLLEKAATSGHIGIGGGTAGSLEISGTRVFFKKINLTDLERKPENVTSTKNIFDLPLYYQYGIGSAGFGAWRELAVHIMSTKWVLDRVCPNFPLMYHWRVLPREVQPLSTEKLKRLDEQVAYWGGSPAIRSRLEAIENASANIVLFLEHIPYTLAPWLEDTLSKDGAAAQEATAMVERDCKAVISFMQSQELLHLDAHFRNILTDGQHLYFTDFGLAISSQFELSEAETNFLKMHCNYDLYETMESLVFHIVGSLCEKESRESVLHEYAIGKGASIKARWASAIVARYAPIAAVMKEFYQKIRKDKSTPFPINELERADKGIKKMHEEKNI